MKLVICESPGKIQSLKKYLSHLGKIKVVASCGHVRDLGTKGMSIDLTTMNPKWSITKPQVVKKLKSSWKGCDELYLATDCDREGEAIAQSLVEILKPKKYHRLIFHSITDAELRKATDNPTKIDTSLVHAQYSRRMIDRLYGYRISGALASSVSGAKSAGRVQSICLKMVHEREQAMHKYLDGVCDNTKYHVTANIGKESYGCCDTDWNQISLSHDDAKHILKMTMDPVGKVADIKRESSNTNPPPPFETSTLQQSASKLGMTPGVCMQVAQKLYESGHITYHRTDCTQLSDEGRKGIVVAVKKYFGEKYVGKVVRRRSGSGAHEPIRPTDSLVDNAGKTSQEIALYQLIWKRSLASCMIPAVTDVVSTGIWHELTHKHPGHWGSGIVWVNRQSVLEEPGWRRVYGVKKTVEEISTWKIGDEICWSSGYTTPQVGTDIKLHNCQSLVGEMKSKGIGRPSTYANMVQVILSRGYVENVDFPGDQFSFPRYSWKSGTGLKRSIQMMTLCGGKNLLGVTELGSQVLVWLDRVYGDGGMMSYQFTKDMEDKLDLIANGDNNWREIIRDFYRHI